MKKIIVTCLFNLFIISAFSQNFEGEIIYSNSYVSKIKNITDEQIGAMIGTKQEYFIKDGNYKSFLNGASISIQQYDYKTNRIYNITPRSDTLYWFDASVNTDGVISFETKKNAAVVLGNKCDAIIMKTKTGTTTIFYSARYKVDGKLFSRHSYGNWAFITSKLGMLPLKTIMETPQFKMVSVATQIKKMQLTDDYFKINSLAPIKKS